MVDWLGCCNESRTIVCLKTSVYTPFKLGRGFRKLDVLLIRYSNELILEL